MISYGGYFLRAHSVQQLANDAARAAIGGLDDAERLTLAQDCVRREAKAFGQFESTPLKVSMANDGKSLAVHITYDGSRDPIWAFAQLGPMPSDQVIRTGSVLLGGL